MVWFITFALICAAGAIFLSRFEKYLEELNWPLDLGVNEGWQPTRRALRKI
jgi:hypothetical protein